MFTLIGFVLGAHFILVPHILALVSLATRRGLRDNTKTRHMRMNQKAIGEDRMPWPKAWSISCRFCCFCAVKSGESKRFVECLPVKPNASASLIRCMANRKLKKNKCPAWRLLTALEN
jgi:hypothetical protein